MSTIESTQGDILAILKNDESYYGEFGSQFLSNSDIKALLTNPKEFKAKSEDNKAFAEGRYFHQLLIEKDKAMVAHHVDVSTRTTKAYKEYLDENGLAFALLTKEKELVEQWAKTMSGNIEFYDNIYASGNEYEVPAVGEIEGMLWKGKADIVCKDFLIDLKTTGDINKFKWNAKAYNYDSQAYIYQTLFGKPLVFYVIDKETLQLGIFVPTASFIESGAMKVKRAIEIYNRYFGPDKTDTIDNYFIQGTLE
jgi:hypothetical protein